MSLLFTKVTVTDSEDGAEFLVRGIPRSIEDLRGYTAFEEFLDGICLDDRCSIKHKQSLQEEKRRLRNRKRTHLQPRADTHDTL